MSVIVKCKSCNGTGYIPMGNGVRGLLVCKACNGVGKYENDEITIINDEYYYKIPNGTSYVYETIPKEFKPYFDKLQQENKQLKEENERYRKLGFKYLNEQNNQLKDVVQEVREYIKDADWLESTGEIKYLDKHNLCGIKVLHNKVEDINKILDKVKEI